MNAGFAAKVHTSEQEIAKLSFELVVLFVENWRRMRGKGRTRIEMMTHFSQLFLDFAGGSRRVWPVEAHPCSAILKPMRTMQRRKAKWQSVGNRFALLRFHFLP